jgi:hypothetical protein
MSSIRTVFGLTVLVAALPASAATTYDLVSDWAPGANPNGTWAYLSGSAILPYWPTMAPLGGAGGFAPSADVGTFLPVFWRPGGSVAADHSGYAPARTEKAVPEPGTCLAGLFGGAGCRSSRLPKRPSHRGSRAAPS